MPKYTAYYRCARCGATSQQTISAPDNRRAIFLLPRWLIVAECRMRRAGGIYKRGDNDK